MNFIDVINGNMPGTINTGDVLYQTIIGDVDFIPEVTIDESTDFNCGALCNELEYARLVCGYLAGSFDISIAEDHELDDFACTFTTYRRPVDDPDYAFRRQLRCLFSANGFPVRLTKGAIIAALDYILDIDQICIHELFPTKNCYFELRIGYQYFSEESDIAFVDAPYDDEGYIEQSYVAGWGVGPPVGHIERVLERLRSAGIEARVVYAAGIQEHKTIDAWVETLPRINLFIDAVIKSTYRETRYIDAEIVV